MALKIGINGFGRIGRNFFRASFKDPELDIVAVNDITNSKTLAHLLKYDSVLGTLEADIKFSEEAIIVNDKNIKVLSEKDPSNLPWKDLGISIVVESTGLFRKRQEALERI